MEGRKLTPDEVLSTKGGRWPIYIKLFAVLALFSVIGELIGTLKVGADAQMVISGTAFFTSPIP